ncbi:MAG: undecaprenyldiphospho-muramoylpentapeptide beta-N-acetylglucosaminyltransferase [Deltaproteobacteria bacterium]|nr:undecaprenyldiphospho-muramoylpentapeptide beta-N-acetylglucosaminyltransferase [Deltaproteobacteria bacterium]
MSAFRAIIAGGGTGGHLFPGIAVAREMEKRFDRTRIIFIVGHRKMEMNILDRYGYEKQSIDVEGLKGRGLLRGAGVMVRLPKGLYQSARVIKRVSPEVILGVGGYTAGPVCLAGRLLGVPTAIHEQNSYPGLTNRVLARVVNKVLISYNESREYFGAASIVLTGNPVREELFVARENEAKVSSRFTILVLGGSQGAQAINTAFVDALLHLRKQGLSPGVIHQTGNLDYERVEQQYRERGLEGEVMPFIEDMAGAYARADLVVSRAGATTLAEIAALGKASILIPYPYAANQHQDTNARVLEQAGGAIVMKERDMRGEDLAHELGELMGHPERVADMERAALARGRRDAARQIVDQLLEMVS